MMLRRVVHRSARAGGGGCFHTLVEMQQDACKRYADLTLFARRDPASGEYAAAGRVSYAAFGVAVNRFRASLATEAGIGPVDTVAVISGNRAEWAVGCYAAMGLGAAYVPMYEQQRPEDWAFILADSGAKAVLCATDAVRQQVAALPALPGGGGDGADGTGGRRALVCFDAPADDPHSFARWAGGAGWAADGAGDGADGAAAADAADGVAVAVADTVTADSLACLIYTSGTTGRPKGVMLSHGT